MGKSRSEKSESIEPTKKMVENKKIKLPPPLQLDSVSPATRLLEKRRLMYEVQKAFEDQKKEFEK